MFYFALVSTLRLFWFGMALKPSLKRVVVGPPGVWRNHTKKNKSKVEQRVQREMCAPVAWAYYSSGNVKLKTNVRRSPRTSDGHALESHTDKPRPTLRT